MRNVCFYFLSADVLRINHHLQKETPAQRLCLPVKMLYRLLGAEMLPSECQRRERKL